MSVARNIFRAIHEGRWLSIEYVNADAKTTYYWISISNIEIKNYNGKYRVQLNVFGLHLGLRTCKQLFMYCDGIRNAEIIEGSFAPRNEKLIYDINANPSKYSSIFTNTHNIGILNYLQECEKLSSDSYLKSFRLLEHLDESKFHNGT